MTDHRRDHAPDTVRGADTVLEFDAVTKLYSVRGAGRITALDDVSFTLRSGQAMGLVGQSGSGKSTIAKILTQLETPTSGQVRLNGRPIPRRGRGLRAYRQQLRMVFQDPFASLNPYHSIRYHLLRPLRLHDVVPPARMDGEVRRLLERVRLDPDAVIDRRPHELSGGQRQRVAIARALASRPKLLVADEPVSMLDVSIRLGVLNLLADLQREEGLGVLYITHDLATARHFSDEILVLNQGRVVERGAADDVILRPQHPYTQQLRAASPDPDTHFAAASGTRGGAQ
jgi:ABC-type glutathione transport system ATPase component